MPLVVEVVVNAPRRPNIGAPVRVEVRDVTLQDVASTTLARRDTAVSSTVGPVATVELEVGPHRGGDRTVWAHVDADGSGRVSKGDYVTTQSYPVPANGEGKVVVEVRQV